MSIVAIDPGTTNTGLVYMDERRILCAKTIVHRRAVKGDQDELKDRAQRIAAQISEWIADKPHEAVIIEGYVTYPGKQNAYTFQTPYLCGYLHAALDGENIVIQTSDAVLNPRKRGNVAALKDAMAEGRNAYSGCSCCTNDHLRSAACHGIYYLRRKR